VNQRILNYCGNIVSDPFHLNWRGTVGKRGVGYISSDLLMFCPRKFPFLSQEESSGKSGYRKLSEEQNAHPLLQKCRAD
jgi:hypothetical protein